MTVYRYGEAVCQCPIRAFSNFYISNLFHMPNDPQCINALYGPFLISTYQTFRTLGEAKMCQCPIRAFSNFYAIVALGLNIACGPVSMPYTGLF